MCNRVVIVWVVVRQVVLQPHAVLQLLLEQVGFVQEEYDVDVREELVLNHRLPQLERVLQAVHRRILCASPSLSAHSPLRTFQDVPRRASGRTRLWAPGR